MRDISKLPVKLINALAKDKVLLLGQHVSRHGIHSPSQSRPPRPSRRTAVVPRHVCRSAVPLSYRATLSYLASSAVPPAVVPRHVCRSGFCGRQPTINSCAGVRSDLRVAPAALRLSSAAAEDQYGREPPPPPPPVGRWDRSRTR